MRLGKNQFCRLYDLAVDWAEDEPKRTREEAARVKAEFERRGARAAMSSIHVNAWLGTYDKVRMAELFLATRYGFRPDRDAATVMYFGDSPNDEPMFERFPLSTGVANVAAHASAFRHHPAYVTSESHGAGFEEGVDTLLSLR
jgi:hypothetical protein